MKKSILAVLLLYLRVLFIVRFPTAVFAGPTENVQAAMQLLKSKVATLGVPNVKGEEEVAVSGHRGPALVVDTTIAEHLEILCLMPFGRFGVVERIQHAESLHGGLLHTVDNRRLRQTR